MTFFKIVLSILFAFLCITSAYVYFKYYKNKKNDKAYVENNEFIKMNENMNGEFYFFYTDWCPHCKEAFKIWDNIKSSNEFTKYNIHFITIDCEDKTQKSIVNTYKIEEYPSYVLNVNGKKYIYDAQLNSESLKKFFNSVYKNQ